MLWIIWPAAIALYLLLCVAVGRFLRLSSMNEATFQEFIRVLEAQDEEEPQPDQVQEQEDELLLKG